MHFLLGPDHDKGDDMPGDDLCPEVLREEVRWVLLTQYLSVRNASGDSHFLNPQSLGS